MKKNPKIRIIDLFYRCGPRARVNVHVRTWSSTFARELDCKINLRHDRNGPHSIMHFYRNNFCGSTRLRSKFVGLQFGQQNTRSLVANS